VLDEIAPVEEAEMALGVPDVDGQQHAVIIHAAREYDARPMAAAAQLDAPPAAG
jgi:hypothetical protein